MSGIYQWRLVNISTRSAVNTLVHSSWSVLFTYNAPLQLLVELLGTKFCIVGEGQGKFLIKTQYENLKILSVLFP